MNSLVILDKNAMPFLCGNTNVKITGPLNVTLSGFYGQFDIKNPLNLSENYILE